MGVTKIWGVANMGGANFDEAWLRVWLRFRLIFSSQLRDST